ncbi:hypothetical protein SAMN05192541_1022 [Bradyrhizobium arachidis]|nr:hypothetical protein SAMN05192541_1022 [Bradyrhizobium arachidis]
MPCDGETVMAGGTQPNPWDEAQRRTRARAFLQRATARNRLAGGEKRRRARVSDGGTAAIGRSATSGESSSSDEADRPCRRAIHPYQRRLGNASTYALPLESLAIPSRLSRRESGSISHPRRGPGAGYKVEAGAIRAHPKLDEFATRRLEPASRCAADPRRRPLLEGEDALLPSFKAAQKTQKPRLRGGGAVNPKAISRRCGATRSG